jgi:glutaredoxin
MDKVIIIWKTPTCVKCPRLMAQLDEHGVPYQVEDLTDPKNEKEFDRFRNDLGIKEVPIVEYGGSLIIGYFYGQIMDLIKQYKVEHHAPTDADRG